MYTEIIVNYDYWQQIGLFEFLLQQTILLWVCGFPSLSSIILCSLDDLQLASPQSIIKRDEFWWISIGFREVLGLKFCHQPQILENSSPGLVGGSHSRQGTSEQASPLMNLLLQVTQVHYVSTMARWLYQHRHYTQIGLESLEHHLKQFKFSYQLECIGGEPHQTQYMHVIRW